MVELAGVNPSLSKLNNWFKVRRQTFWIGVEFESSNLSYSYSCINSLNTREQYMRCFNYPPKPGFGQLVTFSDALKTPSFGQMNIPGNLFISSLYSYEHKTFKHFNNSDRQKFLPRQCVKDKVSKTRYQVAGHSHKVSRTRCQISGHSLKISRSRTLLQGFK